MKDGPNRTWLRLGLEGLVIVVSILLAFSVDALWEQRQDRSRRLEYLSALEGEFSEARSEIESQVEAHPRQLAAIDSLLTTFAVGRQSDSIWLWLRQLGGLFIYGPAHPVFDDLANSGSIGLLDSADLRFALLRYGQEKDFLSALSEREFTLWQDHMAPYLSERTDILPQIFPDRQPALTPRFDSGLEGLYSDRTFQNLLLRRRGTVDSQLRLDHRVADAVEGVLQEIVASH